MDDATAIAGFGITLSDKRLQSIVQKDGCDTAGNDATADARRERERETMR